MVTERHLDAMISRWLEETAPAGLPDRVLQTTFERTRRSRQHVGWRAIQGGSRMTRSVLALGGAAVVVMAVALALNFTARLPAVGGPLPVSDPRSSFLGTWFSADADGSALKMTVRASGEDALEIVVRDTLASVCSGATSTMIGTGRLGAAGELVIPAPAYACDDGSKPEALSGPPLEEQLRNLTFLHDPRTETLTDNFRAVWAREGAGGPGPALTTLQPIWPQSSLEEVRQAQARADAGDPAFTWQVDAKLADWQDASGGEFLARFLREKFGWEEFKTFRRGGDAKGPHRRIVLRCAPGRTNPLYPNDSSGGGCAPTIDEQRYEQMGVDLHQPIREDPTGIWVVTGWEVLEPLVQAVPPSEAEVKGLVEAFLRARIAGKGAEPFADVDEESSPSKAVPLLYATTGGSPYERGEFDVIEGPTWMSGWMRLRVRLFAEGGATVVEQQFDLEPPVEAGRPSLHHRWQWDSATTTENGKPVAVEYRFIPSEVTFRAPWPWFRDIGEAQSPRRIILVNGHVDPAHYDARLAVVADPRPIGRGCEEGPAPADAESLARSIQADPDLDATAPVAVTVGGLPALRMDVDQAPGASLCDNWGQAMVVTAGIVGESSRVRLYLLDLPGRSVRTLAIALTAPKSDFDRVVAAEAPMLASFEFPAP